MIFENQYPLSIYRDISPLCKKGHVVLVQNELDGNLYVKKSLQCYNPEVYLQLQKNPVENTPMIYGIYEEEAETEVLGNRLVIIEEYLPGSTFEELFEEGYGFTEKETIQIGMQLCEILMELHGMNPPIIHRDIKPANVMLMSDGTVRLLDFNAAKSENSSKNRDTVLLGTAGFAAPEQYGFSVSTPQTDIYAMGVLLNIMLTRKHPSEMIAVGKLERIIRCCLEVNPKDRYRNVKELYKALKRRSAVKEDWFLPGFRTMKIYKMLIASAVYLFLFAIAISANYDLHDTAQADYIYTISVIIIGILTIFFYCNYLNCRKWFPLMKSQYKGLRVLGLVINPIIIFWVVLIIATLIEMWFL